MSDPYLQPDFVKKQLGLALEKESKEDLEKHEQKFKLKEDLELLIAEIKRRQKLIDMQKDIVLTGDPTIEYQI